MSDQPTEEPPAHTELAEQEEDEVDFDEAFPDAQEHEQSDSDTPQGYLSPSQQQPTSHTDDHTDDDSSVPFQGAHDGDTLTDEDTVGDETASAEQRPSARPTLTEHLEAENPNEKTDEELFSYSTLETTQTLQNPDKKVVMVDGRTPEQAQLDAQALMEEDEEGTSSACDGDEGVVSEEEGSEEGSVEEEEEEYEEAFPVPTAAVEDEYDDESQDEDESSEYSQEMEEMDASQVEQPDIDEEAAPAPATWNFMAGFTRAADSSDEDDDEVEIASRPSVDDFGNRWETDDSDDDDSDSPQDARSAYSDETSEFMDEHQLAQQQQQTILRERQQRKQQAEEDEEAILYYQSRAACLCYCIIGLIVVFVTIILCLYFLVWKDDDNSGGDVVVVVDDIKEYPIRHLPDYTQEAIETNPASPQALAYTWMNSEANLTKYTPDQANNRFALATLYFAMGGPSWKENRHWLSHTTECVWDGYNCGDGRNSEKELAREQGLTSVSGSSGGNNGIAFPTSNSNSNEPVGNDPSTSEGIPSGGAAPPSDGSTSGGSIGSIGTGGINLNKQGEESKSSGGTGSVNIDIGGRRHLLRAPRHLQPGWMLSDEGVTFAPTSAPVPTTPAPILANLGVPTPAPTTPAPTTLAPTTQLNMESSQAPSTSLVPQDGEDGVTPIDLIRQDDPLITVQEGDESLIFDENNLVGTIPKEISLLTNSLYLLSLNNNPGLVGSIPTQIAEMEGLTKIQISRNHGVTGKIPTELGNLADRLDAIYLHRNSLNGKIPTNFHEMSLLTALWLHHNELTGEIPPELFALASTKENPQLQALEELYLDHNQLTGTIPNSAFYEKDGEDEESTPQTMGLFAADVAASYSSLSKAKHLTLDNNQLTGPIPASLGSYYELETLTLHNNSLTGKVPVEVCGLFLVGKLKRLTVDCHKVTCDCLCECPTEEIKEVDTRPFYDTSTPDAPPSGPVFESLPLESQEAILNDPTSPQALAYNWMSNHPNAGEFGPTATTKSGGSRQLRGVQQERMTLEALEREQQKFALATFFFSTEGEQWERNSNWLSYEMHECDWWSRFATTCSDDNAYESLNLRDNGLAGEFPLELGLLTNLGWMELEDNPDLSGSLPTLLGDLTNLYFMSIQNASLAGSIPSELGRLTGLKELDLGDNALTGTIPVELFDITHMFKVSMANNSLSGPIPSSVGNWNNVSDLHLNGNMLTGTIPRTIGRLTNMEILWLFNNELTGSVPFEICTMLRDGNLKKVHIDCEKVECNCGCECGPPAAGPIRTAPFLTPPSLEANTQSFSEFQSDSLPDFSKQAAINSPQAQALFWLGADPSFDEYDVDKRLQRFALATLYYSTSGERWNDNTHWLSYEVSDCEWASSLLTDNVCNSNGLYESLHLEENALFGALPEEIGVLVDLEEMNLSGNTLRGSLPSTIGLLTKMMYLEMDGSELFGHMPSELGMLSQISEFYIHNNRIEGSIPTHIGAWTSVERVWMNGNKLTGELPTQIGRLTGARMLKVSENDLEGSIPTEVGLMAELRELDIAGNNFEGPLPEEVVNLPKLQELDATNNKLIGPLPILLELLVGMKELLLSNNTFTGTLSAGIAAMTRIEKINLSLNKLNGTIPEEVGQLQDLVTFDISDNDFIGTLPSEIGLLSQLSLFDVSGNKLSDAVPAVFWDLTTARKLDLSNNQFTGELPTSIGNLTAAELNLDHNKFGKKIPSEIGLLQSAGIINLSFNQLTGALPTEIGMLERVGVFDVSGNQALTGPIPVEIGSMKFLRELRMGGTSFIGQLPPVLGQLNKLVTLSLANSRLSGSIPDIFSGMTNLKTVELHFTDLTGSVPLSLCQLKEAGNLEKISVDCDEILCFCECECVEGEPNRGNGPNIMTEPPQPTYVFNETGWVVGDLYDILPNFAQENLANSESAQAQAYRWDLEDSGASSLSTEERLTRYAMATLYYAAGGETWTNNSNWLNAAVSPCDWFTKSENTVCSPTGVVDNVNLEENGLSGSMPEELGLIANMWVLSLNMNEELTGSIPTTFGNFKNAAVLDLHGADLTGAIPSQIGEMKGLVDVFLMKNKFSGSIPPHIGNIGAGLQKMSLEGNILDGELPTEIGLLAGAQALSVRENRLDGNIPSEIGTLGSLEFLDLSLNSFVGGIPTEVGLLAPTLTTFLAEYGTLSEPIPSELGLLQNAVQISLSKNGFSGPLPSHVGRLDSIQFLTLDNNHLNGSIPVDLWGCMNTLSLLDLSYNSFDGSIPKEIFLAGTGSNIDGFHIDHNELTGDIPSEIGMLTSAKTVIMSENDFSGPIPSEIGLLSTNLSWLDLSGSGIEGQLPRELGYMGALTVLLIENAKGLTGSLPDSLGGLASIQELSIVGSEIGGTIPAVLGDAVTLTQLYLNGNALEGAIPSELGKLTALKHLWLQQNFLEGNMPQEICNLGLETLVVDCETVTCSEDCGCTCS